MDLAWLTGIPVVAIVVFAIWVMRRQDRMFPQGTRVGNLDGDRKKTVHWTAWWHRGGSGGL